MKRFLRISAIVFVIFVIAGLLFYWFVINKPHPDYEALEPDFQLNAIELYEDFTIDRTLSENKYNGKMILLNGNLNSVEQADSLTIAVFVFEQGMFGDQGIRCTVLPKYKSQLMKYERSDEIWLKGFCAGYNDVDVILEKTSIVEK